MIVLIRAESEPTTVGTAVVDGTVEGGDHLWAREVTDLSDAAGEDVAAFLEDVASAEAADYGIEGLMAAACDRTNNP